MVRLAGRTRLGRHWSAFGTFEGASGAPLTLVEGVLFVALPVGAGNELQRDRAVGSPAYIYGDENDGRSAGTARMDLGVSYSFTGPWKSRAALGVSVVNAGFGAVAPLRPAASLFEPGSTLGRVRYERLFELPAVPSLTLRVEF